MARSQPSSSGSEEIEASSKKSKSGKKIDKISDYEKVRLKTIEENRKRMEALGLKKMANSLAGSVPKQGKKMRDKKGKSKVLDDEDVEYRPSDEEDEDSGFSSEECAPNDSDADFEDSSVCRNKKAKNSVRTSKNKKTSQKSERGSDYVDDDEALMQAIALSLKDSAGFIDVENLSSQSAMAHVDSVQNDKSRNSQNSEDAGKRKRQKVTNSRVQMKEDELIMHFFRFDELGKGSITLGDLRRVVTAHDFTWSNKEMADMIHYFDNDGNGKLNLDDFSKIAGRCNMIQKS